MFSASTCFVCCSLIPLVSFLFFFFFFFNDTATTEIYTLSLHDALPISIGGGSTWWYLPVWWMLGTFLAWMGGLVTAGQAARGGGAGEATLGRSALPAVAGTVVVAAIARLAGLAVSPPAATGGALSLVLPA